MPDLGWDREFCASGLILFGTFCRLHLTTSTGTEPQYFRNRTPRRRCRGVITVPCVQYVLVSVGGHGPDGLQPTIVLQSSEMIRADTHIGGSFIGVVTLASLGLPSAHRLAGCTTGHRLSLGPWWSNVTNPLWASPRPLVSLMDPKALISTGTCLGSSDRRLSVDLPLVQAAQARALGAFTDGCTRLCRDARVSPHRLRRRGSRGADDLPRDAEDARKTGLPRRRTGLLRGRRGRARRENRKTTRDRATGSPSVLPFSLASPRLSGRPLSSASPRSPPLDPFSSAFCVSACKPAPSTRPPRLRR